MGMTGLAGIGDVARWASQVSAGGDDPEVEKLSANGLPEGTKVTLVYSDGEKEDSDFKEELEATGFLVKLRRVSDGSWKGMADAVAQETLELLTGESDPDL